MPTEEEKITEEFYSKNAKTWVSKHSGRSWEQEHEVFHKLLPQGKIIDLGCGGGNDSFSFVENGYQYLGVDYSEQMLAEARKANPKAEFVNKNLYQLDFPENEFEGFWAACSLLHLPKIKLPAVLENIKRITKTGGVGFVAVKQGQGEQLEPSVAMQGARFYAHYSEEEFKNLLNVSGFEVLASGTKPNPFDVQKPYLYFFVKNTK